MYIAAQSYKEVLIQNGNFAPIAENKWGHLFPLRWKKMAAAEIIEMISDSYPWLYLITVLWIKSQFCASTL